jgi:dTDP-4-amino-4,6-dideoxygalactose transaminase
VANFYKYLALLDPGIDRASVKQALRDEGVTMSGEVYAKPLHAQPVFAGWSTTPLPVAEDVCRRHVCLPLHSDMSDGEVIHVVTTLRKVMGDHVHA